MHHAPALDAPPAPGTGACTVLIPFYQREAGLLLRALRSALAQEGAGRVVALVVDDGSPRPARLELEALAPPERARVRLIEQPNGGPAAARNRGLDELDASTDCVAFLDSDDWWEPGHLATARRALEAGFDLYVGNWFPLDAEQDAYRHFEKLRLEEHEPLPGEGALYRYAGDFLTQELTRPIGRLSTLVMRRAPFADLRFEPRLSCAFEDRLYRMELARRQPRIAFSSEPRVRSGRGVNLFSSRGWGTPGRLETARDELFALRLVRRSFRLNAAQRLQVRSLVRRERRDALSTWLRLVRRGRRLELTRMARLVAADPLFPLLAPLALTRA